MSLNLYDKIMQVAGGFRGLIEQKANNLEIAPPFDSSYSYEPEQMVIYDNLLYVCVKAHSGAWDPADFSPATVDNVLALKPAMSDLGYKSGAQTVTSDGIVLKSRTFNTFDATSYTSSDTIAIAMPTAPGEAADAILRIDTGGSPPGLSIDVSSDEFIPLGGNPEWYELEPVSYNFFTFTYAGKSSPTSGSSSSPSEIKSLWLVGRMNAARG